MNTQEIQTLFTYNDWCQVVTLLRQLGHTPPATDFLVFLDEAGFPS